MATTDKELKLAARRVTLLVHPGTPYQRALHVVDGTRPDHRSIALAHARAKYGQAPLAWLHHSTKKMEAIS